VASITAAQNRPAATLGHGFVHCKVHQVGARTRLIQAFQLIAAESLLKRRTKTHKDTDNFFVTV
jgi:hypothetical protein